MPPVPPVLEFIVGQTRQDSHEAYGSLNMGAGFALFVPQEDVDTVLACSAQNGIQAYHAGVVEDGPKQVVVDPLDIVFGGDSLDLRA
jgi:phosphoribosylformylglycinamidine cyclo-ligase